MNIGRCKQVDKKIKVYEYSSKNIKMSSFKSSENIPQKKEGGPDRSVSDNQSSSVTLIELAMKARKTYCCFEFQQ